MDYFGPEQLIELLAIAKEPTISIYMPIERQARTKKVNRLQFRGAVNEALELFKEGDYEASQYMPIIERLLVLVDDVMFWNGQSEGLAVFAGPDYDRIYRLPVAFEPRVSVGANLYSRPLVKHLLSPERYWVLAVGQKEVSLWEGNSGGLRAIDVKEIPQNVEEALFFDFEKESVNFHSSTHHNMGQQRRHKGNTKGLASPMFHGHGGAKEENKTYTREFFQVVDSKVREMLQDETGPVILAAVDYLHPIYQDVSALPNLSKEGIEGNVHYWNAAQLHEKAWPLAKKVADHKIEEALQLWESSYGRGDVEGDVATVARRIIESRVRLLMVDESRSLWGRFNRETAEIDIVTDGGSDPSSSLSDVLDEMAEQVILLGGKAVMVPSDQMPTKTGVAAILRG